MGNDFQVAVRSTNVLIGIDDTDNLESRGTGFLSQRLLAALESVGLGTALAATRHQLLIDPRIQYTSHNSSACLAWDAGEETDLDGIVAFASQFLDSECAPGSDPGLVVAPPAAWEDPASRGKLIEFGRRAKREILTQAQAWELAGELGIHLSGHGGDQGGVIGSLAGLGLHLSGEDGLFLWMPGVRALTGRLTYAELRARVPIAAACVPGGGEPLPGDSIELGDWVRPVLRGGRAILLLEPQRGLTGWEVSPRDTVKKYSHI